MIAVAVIVHIINIIILFIFKNNFLLYTLVTLIFNLFLGLNFKKLYYNDSMEKVGQIKKNNPNKGFNQLTSIMKQKGGINILYPILLILITIIIIAILNITIGFKIPEIKMPHINMPNI